MDLNSTSPSALKWIHVDASDESPDSDYGKIKNGTVKKVARNKTARLDGTAQHRKYGTAKHATEKKNTVR